MTHGIFAVFFADIEIHKIINDDNQKKQKRVNKLIKHFVFTILYLPDQWRKRRARSNLGVFRIGHDVLEDKLDLIFVEFAVNEVGKRESIFQTM